MAPDLQVSVSRRGDTAVVLLRGELDLASAASLEGRLRDLLEPRRDDPVAHLSFDMSGLDFIDVAGLRVVLRAADDLRARGGSASLRAPSVRVRRLLDLLSLDLPVEDEGTH